MKDKPGWLNPPETNEAKIWLGRMSRFRTGIYVFFAGVALLVGLAVIVYAPIEGYERGLAGVLAFMLAMGGFHLILRECRPFAGRRLTWKEKMATRRLQMMFLMDSEKITWEQAHVRLKEELKAQKERRREWKRRRRQGPSSLWGDIRRK